MNPLVKASWEDMGKWQHSFPAPYHAEPWLLCVLVSLGVFLFNQNFPCKNFLQKHKMFPFLFHTFTCNGPTSDCHSRNAGTCQTFLLRTVCVLPATWFIFNEPQQSGITQHLHWYKDGQFSLVIWRRISKVSQPLSLFLSSSSSLSLPLPIVL